MPAKGLITYRWHRSPNRSILRPPAHARLSRQKVRPPGCGHNILAHGAGSQNHDIELTVGPEARARLLRRCIHRPDSLLTTAFSRSVTAFRQPVARPRGASTRMARQHPSKFLSVLIWDVQPNILCHVPQMSMLYADSQDGPRNRMSCTMRRRRGGQGLFLGRDTDREARFLDGARNERT